MRLELAAAPGVEILSPPIDLGGLTVIARERMTTELGAPMEIVDAEHCWLAIYELFGQVAAIRAPRSIDRAAFVAYAATARADLRGDPPIALAQLWDAE